MLMIALTNRYAHQLIAAREKAEIIPSLSSRYPITIDDAYEIAERISDIRIAEGETIIGRKIDAIDDRSLDNHQKTKIPFWSWLYDTSVHFIENNEGSFSLKNIVQPRIETEVIFCLGCIPPENATAQQMAECIEWMAHGLEITEYLFGDRPRHVIDAVLAFGMHAALLVGEPKIVSEGSRKSLAAVLECASVSLSLGNTIKTAGFGSDTFSNPLQGLCRLHKILKQQSQYGALKAGDIIATGSWTSALPVKSGEIWQTAFSGLPLSGLTVKLIQ